MTDQSERRAERRRLALDELDDLRRRMVEDVNRGCLDAATAYRLEMEAIQVAARLTEVSTPLPRDLFRLPPELLP